MSIEENVRKQLIVLLLLQLQITGTNSVMYSKAIGDLVGLNTTDLESLEIISRAAPITAGYLAQETGMTTGAVTGIIDRLEKGNFVRREYDEKDRRKVLVHLNKEKVSKEIAPLYTSLTKEMSKIADAYSDTEIQSIISFLEKVNTKTIETITTLKKQST